MKKVEGTISDVLIKDITDRGVDEVFIVDNLPKAFLFKNEQKMIIDYTDPQNRQLLVPDFEVLDNGMKRRTGATTEVLLAGIELSDSGDGAYVFHTELNSAKDALQAIDNYINRVYQGNGKVPERVPYAAQPGSHNSAPIPRNQIPRVVLPELVSPPAVEAAQVPAPRALSEGHTPQAPANRVVEDRMAKARAAKAAKAVAKADN